MLRLLGGGFLAVMLGLSGACGVGAVEGADDPDADPLDEADTDDSIREALSNAAQAEGYTTFSVGSFVHKMFKAGDKFTDVVAGQSCGFMASVAAPLVCPYVEQQVDEAESVVGEVVTKPGDDRAWLHLGTFAALNFLPVGKIGRVGFVARQIANSPRARMIIRIAGSRKAIVQEALQLGRSLPANITSRAVLLHGTRDFPGRAAIEATVDSLQKGASLIVHRIRIGDARWWGALSWFKNISVRQTGVYKVAEFAVNDGANAYDLVFNRPDD